jgi:hypothetical protein
VEEVFEIANRHFEPFFGGGEVIGVEEIAFRLVGGGEVVEGEGVCLAWVMVDKVIDRLS